jgi:crotonobetainyl-CoA:carnitine CoA-transferase CaiB-like acyl-CoA transferase
MTRPSTAGGRIGSAHDAIDQRRRDVWQHVSRPATMQRAMKTSGRDVPRVGPLDDVRVLDLSRFLSGPYATTVLADLGADVVKILKPGEAVGGSGPLTIPEVFDWATNRDKRSIGIDLRSAEGRETLLGLVSRADVVFSNLRPGVMERLGLGFDRLQAANPRIISCEISGFGDSGSWAEMPSYDLIAQAASGSIDITGPHDDPRRPPCRWGVPIGDIAAALYAVIGLLAALAVRDRDGVGQRVSVSMLDGLLSFSTYRAPQVFDVGLSARTDQHMGGGGTRPYGPIAAATEAGSRSASPSLTGRRRAERWARPSSSRTLGSPPSMRATGMPRSSSPSWRSCSVAARAGSGRRCSSPPAPRPAR